jgi:hypothetical protein
MRIGGLDLYRGGVDGYLLAGLADLQRDVDQQERTSSS